MKILYVITSLEGGGAQNLLADTCKVLAREHEVGVVILRNDMSLNNLFTQCGVEVLLIDVAERGFFGCVSELRKVIKKTRPDVLHTHLLLADNVGRLAGLTCGVRRIVSTLHGEDAWREEKNMLFLRMFERFTINNFKRVKLIAVSENVKAHCVTYERIKSGKIQILYNFIQTRNPEKRKPGFRYYKGPGEFTIVTAARLESEKCHIDILNALKTLRDPSVKLILLGTGSLTDFLRGYAEANEINVKFAGFKPNVYDYLAAADLFVLASKSEGQSIAILEAFYNKTPVLASDIASNRALLRDGERGELYQFGNTGELAGKIAQIKSGAINTDYKTRKAYEFCVELTPENYAKSLMKIYETP